MNKQRGSDSDFTLGRQPARPPDGIDPDYLVTRASSVLDRIASIHNALDRLDDSPGERIHALYAGIYWFTTDAWLSYVIRQPNPEFACLVIARFFELYKSSAPTGPEHVPDRPPAYWRRYLALSKNRTLRDPISIHLVLVSLAARAHTRHDLAVAVRRAYDDYCAAAGKAPDMEAYRTTVVGHRTDALFYDAAIRYIAFHRGRQRGWRRLVLGFYDIGLRIARPVWLPIFQSWRKAAWKDADNHIRSQRLAVESQQVVLG